MIVLSYRRADSPGFTRALRERLVGRLGAGRVFLDVEAIEAGADFRERLRATVAGARALVVVIGPDWLAPGANGQPRLADPADAVRLEIATALDHGVRVIPVLVDGAAMPGASDLPSELRTLADRNAIVVSNERFDADVDRLLDAIGQGSRRRTRRRIAGLVLSLGVSTLLMIWLIWRDAAADDVFTMVVRVSGPGGTADLVTGGELMLDLDGERRRQSIDSDGEAVFAAVPARFRGERVTLIPRVEGYDSAPRMLTPGATGVLDLRLSPAHYETRVRGSVIDGAGRGIADVKLEFDNGLADAITDSAGRFEVVLPLRPGSVITVRAVHGDVVGYNDRITVPERTLVIPFAPGG